MLSVDDFSGLEGTTQSFTVTLANPRSGKIVTVDYVISGDEVAANADTATAPGHATKPADFEPDTGGLTGTVTFDPACQTSCTVGVRLLADYEPENPETLRLTLTNPSGAVLSGSDPGNSISQIHGVGTITDDPPPTLSVEGFRAARAPGSPSRSRWPTPARARRRRWTTPSRPARPIRLMRATTTRLCLPADLDGGTLSFSPGVTVKSVTVDLVHDNDTERDEKLELRLSNAVQAHLPADTAGVGTITDVIPPYLVVDDMSAHEGTDLVFTVTLCNPRAGDTVTVDYRTADREAAVQDGDFEHMSGTLEFVDSTPDVDPSDVSSVCGGDGVSAKSHTVRVKTLTDLIAENDERLHLVLSENPDAALNAVLEDRVGVGTIINSNAPVVRVSNARAKEGEMLTFVISLVDVDDNAADYVEEVIVTYQTADRGSAVADEDYEPVTGMVTFPARGATTLGGFTTHDVAVTLRNDTEDEDDEIFALVAAVPERNASLGKAEGTGTIEDRPPPYVRIDNPDAVREGDSVTFTVSLEDENGQLTSTSEIVTVEYATRDRTAEAGLDYEQQSGTLTFDPDESQKTITVQTSTDDIWEPEETFRVDLSQPDNAILDKAVGTGRIRPDCVNINVDDQDNRPPVITVRDEQGPESSLRVVNWLTLSRPLCDAFSFTIRVVEGTTGSPATDDDFLASTMPFSRAWGGRVHPASVSEVPVFAENHPFTGGHFGPLDDTLDEDDEYFYIEVSWSADMPTHYQIQDQDWARATVTIIDDDDPPNLRISDAAAPAGESMTFNVTLDAASGRTVQVDYRTVDVTADGGVDYDSVSSWETLLFDPGARTETFDVQTASNSPDETDDETFRVELANPVNAGIGDSIGVGTILAGAGPALTIFDAAGDEGGPMSFSVRLSEPAAQEVTVDYATVERTGSGAAEEGVDYQPASGTLTFLVGDDEEFIGVTVEADGTDEPDETFLVELSNQTSGVSLADASALGTINGNVACVDRTDTNQSMPTATLSGTSAREDAGQMTMTITLTQPFCQPYDFAFQARSSSATLNVDFAEPSSVRLPALVTEADFHAVLFDDDLVEGDETFLLRVRTGVSPGVRNLPEINSLSTIIDDDVATLQVPAVGETSTAEGGFLSFVMRLDQPTEETVTFAYETADGSVPAATTGADYAPVRGTATIPPGELSVTLAVGTIEDALFEHDENVELRLSNLTGAEPDPDGDVAVGRILDDDDPPAVRVSNPSGDEGAALVFAVTLDAPSGRAGSVTYSTRDGTATAGLDYGPVSGGLDFAAGDTVKTVAVESFGDDVIEGSERFFLDLDSSDFGFDKRVGTGIIRDVTLRRVSVSDADVDEGGVLNFVVGFNGPPASRDITVAYSTAAVTAGAGIDYSDAVESAPGVVRILAGRTSAVVRVQTLPDTLDEDLEQLRLVLSDPVGAVLVGAGEAVGTIIDDDPEPLLSVDDPEATENGDGTPITFTVSLSEVSGRDVEVSYSTVDSSAVAGDDYVAATSPVGSPLVIPRGARSVEVPVTLVDDDVEEVHERFLLELSDPVNAEFGDTVGAGTILDDDGLIEILLDTPDPVYEGPGATVDFVVRLSRADPVDPVTFGNYMVGGSADPFDDYTPFAISWTIDPGDTSLTIPVQLVDDDVVEDTESFLLGIGDASSNATISGKYYVATATILDDDALPELSVSDAPVATEGATAMFSVELSRSSTRPVTVEYAAVVDPFGGDAAAIPGQDFEAVTGTLTIPARSTSATVAVPLPDDALDEHTETFWLRLADPVGAGILDGTGVGRIDDDDPLPQLSVGDSGATEGGTIRFTVRLDTASGRTVTVPWTTAASYTGDPASPTDDYVSSSGTLTFPSGTTSVTIDIDTVDDEVSEPDETFQIQLGQPTDATVDDGVAVGAIVDDDGLPRISIAGDTVLETDGPAKFVVTLSRTSSQTVTMDYATTEVTATAATGIGKDYGPPSGEATGTLVIPAGLDRGEISVYVADDDVPEGTETFHVSLSNAVNAVIAEGAGTAVGTILDDDVARIAVGDANAYEADGTIEFPVTLSAASDHPVSVRYTTFDGSAAQPDDYIAASGTLTIPAQTTTATIPVTLTDDHFTEDAESFLIRLSDPTDAEISTAEAVGAILDDDDLPVILLPDYAHFPENVGTVSLRLTLNRASDREVRVDYATRDYTGACDVPFVPASGTVVFPPGSVAEEFEITLVDDQEQCAAPFGDHERRYFIVDLTNPQNATFGTRLNYNTRLGQFVIRPILTERIGMGALDIAQLPCVGSTGPDGILEGAGTAVFTPRLNYASNLDARFRVYTATGVVDQYSGYRELATSDVDYTALDTILTIPAGSLTTEIAVNIIDDDLVENAEGFQLVARAVENVRDRCQTWAEEADVWIIDDDAPPQISVGDIDVAEDAGIAAFVVSLDRVSASAITVDYATADGSATDPGDYTETAGTVQIDAGLTTAFVEVPLTDDAAPEQDETFTLLLSNSSGAGITDGEATATISDDDDSTPLPSISVADVAGSDNDGSIRFVVTLSEPSTDDVTFRASTVAVPSLGDRAAMPLIGLGSFNGDYRPLSGEDEYTITAGQTGTYFLVWLAQYDRTPEFDEMFKVVLHDVTGATLGDASAWATILDDDMPIVTVDDARASEDAGSMSFTVHLHEPGVYPASLRYTTRARPSEGDAAARPGADYLETTGKLDIAAGETTATISVPIIGDSIDEELEETFLFELSDAEALEFSDSAAVGTIVDDDPGWVIDDRSVRENDASMVFTVISDHPSTSAVTLNYTVTGASAMGGNSCADTGVDYITPSGSVTLLPAQTQAEISVTVCDDDVVEGSETLFIELTGVPGRKLTGTGTIVDDSGG